MNELKDPRIEVMKSIAEAERKLAALRAEYDRLDANHPAQCVQVMVDIRQLADGLDKLLKLQSVMNDQI